jgi:hypothetical protein
VAEHREKSQLFGDFLREIAVLVIVFWPIEAGFRGTFDWSIFSLIVVLALILLWLGMILEGRDEI